MTLAELLKRLDMLDAKLLSEFDVFDKRRVVFARLAKVTEELGEVANEVLMWDGLQSAQKMEKAKGRDGLEEELGDLIFSSILLGKALGLEMDEVIEKRLELIEARKKEGGGGEGE